MFGLSLALASGCVIAAPDDDDDAGDAGDGSDGGDGDGGDDAADDGGDDAADDGGDETGGGGDDGVDDGGDGAGADEPEAGLWVYSETGGTTNDCTFLREPTNGFGQYQVVDTGDGTFHIIPGDDTEPFECEGAGGQFSCDERLTDELSAGGVTLQVLVSIDGELPSSTSMTGAQDGTIECTAGDCATAAAVLGTSLPCSFSIPFSGDKI